MNNSARVSLREIRPDEERRLHIADEDIGRGRQADRAADTERALEHKGKSAHDGRQDFPVEQERREHAHHQHDGQAVEGEHELAAGSFRIEGQRAAAEIAEHEGSASLGRRRHGIDRAVDRRHRAAHRRDFQEDDRQRDGEREADRHAPPGHGIALLADDVSQRQQRDDAESGLKLQHGTHQPVKPAGQSEARSMPGSSTAARRGRTYPRPGFRCDPDVTGPGNFPQRPCRG